MGFNKQWNINILMYSLFWKHKCYGVNISYIKSIGFDSLKDNKIKWVKFRDNNILRDFLEKFDIEKIVLIRIFYIIENLWIIIGNN